MKLLRQIFLTILCTAALTSPGQIVTEYPACKLAKGAAFTIPLDTTLRRLSAEVRAAVSSNPAHGNASWQATITDSHGLPLCRATVSWGETGFDDAFSRRYLRLTVDTADSRGNLRQASAYDRFDNVDLHRGPNSLIIDIADSRVSFAIGSDLMIHAGEAVLPTPAAAIEVSGNRTLNISNAALKSYPERADRLATAWTPDSLADYFATTSTFPIEGYWEFLDRDNNPKWSLPGGFYTLAVVKSPEAPDTFDVIYLDGARTCSGLWKPGMRKGRLKATQFVDHYRLEWTDAELNDAGPECSAILSSPAILQLNFPLHHASIRFSRRQPVKR